MHLPHSRQASALVLRIASVRDSCMFCHSRSCFFGSSARILVFLLVCPFVRLDESIDHFQKGLSGCLWNCKLLEPLGFDPQQVAGGYGLGDMRERMERLGGQLEISSTPGAGTRVVAQIDLLEL